MEYRSRVELLIDEDQKSPMGFPLDFSLCSMIKYSSIGTENMHQKFYTKLLHWVATVFHVKNILYIPISEYLQA